MAKAICAELGRAPSTRGAKPLLVNHSLWTCPQSGSLQMRNEDRCRLFAFPMWLRTGRSNLSGGDDEKNNIGDDADRRARSWRLRKNPSAGAAAPAAGRDPGLGRSGYQWRWHRGRLLYFGWRLPRESAAAASAATATTTPAATSAPQQVGRARLITNPMERGATAALLSLWS